MNRKIWWGAGIILGIGLVYLIYSWTNAKVGYHGTLIDPPSPTEDFTVQSDRGDVHLSDFRGKVVLLYFGYTFCPDACPITLSKLSQVYKNLGDDADQVQTLFISVDPERDTPQVLGTYARAFDPRFVGATSTPEAIAVIAKQFGIFYQKRPVNSAAGYLVDHTSVVWVIDQRGNLRLEWPYDFDTSFMVSDLKALLKQS